MKIKIHHQLVPRSNCVVIPLVQDSSNEKILTALFSELDWPAGGIPKFDPKPGKVLRFPGKNGKSLFLIGLGEKPNYPAMVQAFRSFSFSHKEDLTQDLTLHLRCGNAPRSAKKLATWVEAAVNGLLVGTYNLGLYKTSKSSLHPLGKKGSSLEILSPSKEINTLKRAVEKAKATAETQLSVFDLVNGPGNKVKPSDLAKWAQRSGKKHGFEVKVLNKAAIKKTGLDALLAVNKGSEYPPAFIIMEYRPKNRRKGMKLPKIGLVGKGVTFDTGGLSIKTNNNMHYMKSDMGGAAAVLGAVELAAKLELAIHLIGIIPSTDNCVDANSVKPGDVINSYSGKTIEIIDTDAEGRLLLADGLAYMKKNYDPDVMIDLATLTGSCVRTLGYQAGGLFSANDELVSQLEKAGTAVGERLWRLPIWDEYAKDIESDVADVKNFSGRPVAGAISAAKFLEAFTDQHPAWAHLDIAGMAFADSPFAKQKSATAFGVNLLVEYLRRL